MAKKIEIEDEVEYLDVEKALDIDENVLDEDWDNDFDEEDTEKN